MSADHLAGKCALLAFAATPSAPAQSAVAEKSIAVLPFVDMSEKKDEEYFGDGLSEELIDLLAQTQALQVIARTSSFYFKGKSEKITTIARELGVRYVLEGSVRKAGNTLRVTAQLIRADTGVHLWSDSFDRNLKDMFKVQDEIAASVVHALKATLLTQVSRAKRDAANIDPYTLMLQARFLIGRGSEADVQQSIVLLERALALDLAYAPAWIELSRAHAFRAGQLDSTPGANIAQARAADREGAGARSHIRRRARCTRRHQAELRPRCAGCGGRV